MANLPADGEPDKLNLGRSDAPPWFDDEAQPAYRELREFVFQLQVDLPATIPISTAAKIRKNYQDWLEEAPRDQLVGLMTLCLPSELYGALVAKVELLKSIDAAVDDTLISAASRIVVSSGRLRSRTIIDHASKLLRAKDSRAPLHKEKREMMLIRDLLVDRAVEVLESMNASGSLPASIGELLADVCHDCRKCKHQGKALRDLSLTLKFDGLLVNVRGISSRPKDERACMEDNVETAVPVIDGPLDPFSWSEPEGDWWPDGDNAVNESEAMPDVPRSPRPESDQRDGASVPDTGSTALPNRLPVSAASTGEWMQPPEQRGLQIVESGQPKTDGDSGPVSKLPAASSMKSSARMFLSVLEKGKANRALRERIAIAIARMKLKKFTNAEVQSKIVLRQNEKPDHLERYVNTCLNVLIRANLIEKVGGFYKRK